MIGLSKHKLKVIAVILVLLAIITLTISIGMNHPSFQTFLGKIRYYDQRCVDSQGVFAFYNVGNADASLIYTNQTIGFVDVGFRESIGVLTKNLSELKTDSLDFVVLSHPHSDHAGGYLELIKHVKIKRLFIRKYTQKDFENLSLYNEILNASQKEGIEVIYVTHGMNVHIGDISLLFFDGSHSSVDENHNSLLVKAKIGNTECLYTGDAGKQVEQYLLSLGCDLSAEILKVGHHGSNSASSQEFLQTVSPLYSVISVGYNQYDHPHKETIHHLIETGCTTYRTDICERILFEVKDAAIDVTVE